MGACELTSSSALTSTRGSARRRGTTDAWPFLAAKCRGVHPTYRDTGADDEGRGARALSKAEEGVREHRRRRGVFVGDSETASSRLIKNLGLGDSDSKNTTLSQSIEGHA